MAVDLSHREAGNGSPLVLLHAFPLSAAMWLPQREGLSGRCRVVTPDLRGFGGSDLGHDEPSMDASADDVARLLDRLDLATVVLGGLSMGGYVAMALLRRHPERVTALILADTKAGADPPAGRANRERIARAVEEDPASTVLLDDVLPTLVGPTTVATRPMVLGRVRGLLQAAPPAAVAWAQRAMASRPDSLDTLRAARLPALVVVGDEDTLAPPDAAQEISAALEGSTLVRIPQVGHLSAVEDPDAFNTAVSEFLDRL